MHAYRIILTHFSQRYHYVPAHPIYKHSNNVVTTFDAMNIECRWLPALPTVMPVLMKLFVKLRESSTTRGTESTQQLQAFDHSPLDGVALSNIDSAAKDPPGTSQSPKAKIPQRMRPRKQSKQQQQQQQYDQHVQRQQQQQLSVHQTLQRPRESAASRAVSFLLQPERESQLHMLQGAQNTKIVFSDSD
jgi:flagellar motor protein MotB